MSRKKRFINNPPSNEFRLTKNKLDILEMIWQMEIPNSDQLRVLLPHISPDGMTATLTTLHKVGLVDKTKGGFLLADRYKITDFGSETLSKRRNTSNRYVWTHRPQKGPKARIEYPHAKLIVEDITNIRAGAIKHGIKIISQGEIASNAGLDIDDMMKLPATTTYYFSKTGRTETDKKGDATPDGLFGIQRKSGNKSYFVTEQQNEGSTRRNSLDKTSMLRKFLWYFDTHENKTFEKEWGIDNLRVLFRFVHEVDYTASVKLANELFPEKGGCPMFLFIHLPADRETDNGDILENKPYPDLFTAKWTRAGLSPTALHTPDK